GHALDARDERRFDAGDGRAGRLQDGAGDASLLPHQRQQEVLHLDRLLSAVLRLAGGSLKRLLRLLREPVQSHGGTVARLRATQGKRSGGVEVGTTTGTELWGL